MLFEKFLMVAFQIIRAMTYAELYGNIKKRPLKGGLGNKMMAGEVTSMISGLGALGALNESHLTANSVSGVKDFMSESIGNSVSLMAGLERVDTLTEQAISPLFKGNNMPSL